MQHHFDLIIYGSVLFPAFILLLKYFSLVDLYVFTRCLKLSLTTILLYFLQWREHPPCPRAVSPNPPYPTRTLERGKGSPPHPRRYLPKLAGFLGQKEQGVNLSLGGVRRVNWGEGDVFGV